MKKILFVCPYPPGLVPSQRFRFEQYLDQLMRNGATVEIKPFFSEKAYHTLYQSGNLFSKIITFALCYINRHLLLFQLRKFDFIFLHREAAPVGPPFIEYVIAKVLQKKIIYDFDDAIWLTDRTNESFLHKLLRWRNKVGSICRWSYKISCGNSYLANYARKFNSQPFINPTTIDTEKTHVEPSSEWTEKVTIGWTGSHSTLKYLRPIVPVLQLLKEKHPTIAFLVIADEDPALPLKSYTFRQWKKETEIGDLGEIDIGIMPLPDDPWTRGKCGFKALQYMAMGIPALVSPVGANKEIVRNGIDGFWCDTNEEWYSRLEQLVLNPKERVEMGKLGRERVINLYSVEANSANFRSLFE